MNISSNYNNLSFGKTPVMTCRVNLNDKKEKVSATVYQMDTGNFEDLREIRSSKTGRKIFNDFQRDAMQCYPHHEYFLLKNDDTDEVICAAETSHHLRNTDDKTNGLATVIDEFALNNKYNNPAEPMLANIVKTAWERYDNSVVSSIAKDDLPDLKRASFSETKKGDWMIPEKRFSSMLNKAEERCQTVFLA